MADDLGYETIGANGGTSYRTPHLDRLAATGARFEHCYAQPLCTPSRVQIMTGQYNVRNYRRFGRLERGQTTFAHLLKERGYATAVAGKWQLGKEPDSPRHFGFDESLLWQHTRGRTRNGTKHDSRYENPRLERNGVEMSFDGGAYAPDLMVDFITDFIGRHEDRPFFVYYPMILVHCPFGPTPDSADWNPESKGSKTYKGDPAFFGDQVAYMDGVVGRLVGELEARGLAEKTLVLFTGDNGTDRPIVSRMNGRDVAGQKNRPTDAGTRVPLICSWPGQVEPTMVHDLVDFSDFLPTICAVAGIDPGPKNLTLDGRSFLPQLRGETGNPRDFIYCWYSRAGKDEKAEVFARTHRYKLYRSGAFFDVQNDVEERSALPAASLDDEQMKVRSDLQKVIDRYETVRRESSTSPDS